jgi:hypothetical protein
MRLDFVSPGEFAGNVIFGVDLPRP